MSYEEIATSANVVPAINSGLCSLMAAYTVISILDHERWMKEWGNDHEAVAVMHLRFPILSAALMMGVGGITTVHHVGLASLDLEGIEMRYDVFLIIVASAVAVGSFFATVAVARRDIFEGVDRIERLKMAILDRHTIADLKRSKDVGKKMAYFGRPFHVVVAGVILASGLMGSWMINVLAMAGDFYVVWRPWHITGLAVCTLVSSVASSWLLFRVLVWKSTNEPLRPLCSVLVALSFWAVDFLGNFVALRYEEVLDRKPNGALSISALAGEDSGQWELMVLAFSAVCTQYAIALELRLAYCGLQDANLDLQLLAGSMGFEEHSRKSSAMGSQIGGRRPTNGGGSRVSPSRRRRVSVAGSPMVSPGGTPANARTTPLSRPVTMATAARKVHLTGPSAIAAAFTRMSFTIGITPTVNSRNIKVQPVGNGSAYMAKSDSSCSFATSCGGVAGDGDRGGGLSASTTTHPEEGEESEAGKRPFDALNAGWAVVQGRAGETVGVGPSKKIELPSRVV